MRKTRIAGTAAVLAAGLLISAQGANANTQDIGCTNGSYSGYVRITYTPGGTGTLNGATITNRQYKLAPADSASDQNDISYLDTGTVPNTSYSTGSAIRDNVLHTLTGTDYSRGSATIQVGLNFDVVNAPDKSCSKTLAV